MVTRQMTRDAVISRNGIYRYQLTRSWDASLRKVAFVMLNPSTADGLTDDPTIRKCVGFAERWGFGGFVVTNAFAYRATDPTELVDAAGAGIDPVGPDNPKYIVDAVLHSQTVVAAWGASTPKGSDLYLHRLVKSLTAEADVWCIGRTKNGAPRHPLMVGYDKPLELFAEYAPSLSYIGPETHQ